MQFYSIYADSESYRTIAFDRNKMFEEYGSLRNHFNLNYEARPFANKIKMPFNISLNGEQSDFSGHKIPDISEHYGRLFLTEKAYEVVKDIIKNDGEFLPVICDGVKAYIFNTLSLAESVGGLDTELSSKDEMGNRTNIAFHANNVKEFSIFKTEFDHFISAYCQQSLKEAIESAELKGVFFTANLGNRLAKKPIESWR